MPNTFSYEVINKDLMMSDEIKNEYKNYCLYESFFINLIEVLPDVEKKISFDEFLKMFGKKDLYSYFVDFLINFPKIKTLLKDKIQLFKVRKLFNNWKIGIFLKVDDKICNELTVLEFKYLNFPQIKRKKYTSIKKAMMDKFNYKDPYLVCFLQDKDHFVPIKIKDKMEVVENATEILEFLNHIELNDESNTITDIENESIEDN